VTRSWSPSSTDWPAHCPTRAPSPRTNPRQEAHLVELLRSGEYTTAELGDLFGVARSTVYRAVARSKTAAVASRATTTAVPRPISRPIINDGAIEAANGNYPRHGAPSDIPSKNRGRTRARTVRPDTAPQTGH
jgi:hypothetical protein